MFEQLFFVSVARFLNIVKTVNDRQQKPDTTVPTIHIYTCSTPQLKKKQKKVLLFIMVMALMNSGRMILVESLSGLWGFWHLIRRMMFVHRLPGSTVLESVFWFISVCVMDGTFN